MVRRPARTTDHQNNINIPYHSWPGFQRYARALGLMDDEKAGIPWTAYEGIVETRPLGDDQLLFLVPLDIKSTEQDMSAGVANDDGDKWVE